MSDDVVYCLFVDGLCKRKYFNECAVLKRVSAKWYRGEVFPYDCPRACEAWLARRRVVPLGSWEV